MAKQAGGAVIRAGQQDHRRAPGRAVPMSLALLLGAGLAAATPGPESAGLSTTIESPDLAVVADRPGQPLLAMERWGSSSITDTDIEVRGVEQIRLPDASDIAVLAPTTTAPTTAPPTTATPTSAPPTSIAPATTASPTAAPTVSAPTPQDRGALALSRISYPWTTALPGWTITFEAGRSGVFGFTYVQEQRIEIFVRDDQSDALLAHVVAHEIGHAVDVSKNDSNDRQRWQQARGIESVPWWPGNGLTDFSTGAGDFAEAFAAWQIGPGSYRSRVAGAPTAEQLAVLAELAG